MKTYALISLWCSMGLPELAIAQMCETETDCPPERPLCLTIANDRRACSQCSSLSSEGTVEEESQQCKDLSPSTEKKYCTILDVEISDTSSISGRFCSICVDDVYLEQNGFDGNGRPPNGCSSPDKPYCCGLGCKECCSDDVCPNGQICSNAECRDGCRTDDECTEDEICHFSRCRLQEDICFSASMAVSVLGEGQVSMENLSIGDKVQVASGRYEPIYSFVKKNRSDRARFVEIHTKELPNPLQLSKTHFVFTKHQVTKLASETKVGDTLLMSVNGTQKEVPVLNVRSVERKDGFYAPLTYSGTIVVNGVLASTYASPDATLKLGQIDTGVSSSTFQHFIQSPHRLACKLYFNICRSESYDSNGFGTLFSLAKPFYEWWTKNFFAASFLAIILVLISGIAAIFELFLFVNTSGFAPVLLAVVSAFYMFYQKAMARNTNGKKRV